MCWYRYRLILNAEISVLKKWKYRIGTKKKSCDKERKWKQKDDNQINVIETPRWYCFGTHRWRCIAVVQSPRWNVDVASRFLARLSAAARGRLHQGHHDGRAGGDGIRRQVAQPAAAQQVQLQPAGRGQRAGPDDGQWLVLHPLLSSGPRWQTGRRVWDIQHESERTIVFFLPVGLFFIFIGQTEIITRVYLWRRGHFHLHHKIPSALKSKVTANYRSSATC